MYLKSIRFAQYRNLKPIKIELSQGLNVFMGANAQGKTNVLEGIACLENGRSFRGAKINEMIQNGCEAARVEGIYQRDDSFKQLAVGFNGSGRTYFLEGNKINDLKEYLGRIRFVVFSAEMLEIISGAPVARRGFMDKCVFSIDPQYILLLREYRKILQARNTILSNENLSMEILDTWTERLIDYGKRIVKKRLMLIEGIKPLAENFHRQISDKAEKLGMNYVCSFLSPETIEKDPDIEEISNALREKLLNETTQNGDRPLTYHGPHRDDIRITINDEDIRTFGSRGQKRTALMALKLAELNLCQKEFGHTPILILDDIAAELDRFRQQCFINSIPSGIQMLVSLTENDECYHFSPMKTFHVNKGLVEESC